VFDGVISGDSYPLDCGQYSGTELILADGNRVILSCPIGGNASLTELTFDGLPGALNSRFTFVSGLETEITPDRQTLNGRTTLDFMIPTGYAGCQLRHSALGREQVDGTSQLQNRWRFLRIPDEPIWYLRAGHEIDLLMSPKRDGA
jgi:hypothetical protein